MMLQSFKSAVFKTSIVLLARPSTVDSRFRGNDNTKYFCNKRT
ncbi:MAG: hypothetical protein V4642_09670 [Bacteroidota bacterium]